MNNKYNNSIWFFIHENDTDSNDFILKYSSWIYPDPGIFSLKHLPH
jgi:hypothetical protein